MTDSVHEMTKERDMATPRSESGIEALVAEIPSVAPEGVVHETLEAFARAFHFRTPPSYFNGHARELAQEIAAAFSFADGRGADEIRVRVAPVDGAAILQTNMDDQPFILDTVLETLRVSDVAVRDFLHPILQIDRDSERRIVSVQRRTAPGQHESFLHFRLGSIGAKSRGELEREVHDALQDARRAVGDFSKMKQTVDSVAQELAALPAADASERRDMEETADLLRWLLHENFVLLGYRQYRVLEQAGEECLQAVPGSGLGILRNHNGSAFHDPVPLREISKDLRRRLELRLFPIVSKTNAFSRVHRRTPMDSILIKRIDAEGRITGEHRILGLFTAQALNQMCSEIPVLRRKLRAVLRRAAVLEGSHEYKEIVSAFNSTPKAELFASSVEQIARNIEQLLELQTSNELRVSCHEDVLGQRTSVMVVMPRERFNSVVRQRIQSALNELFGVAAAEYRLALSEETYVRLHFYYQQRSGKLAQPAKLALDRAVAEAIRTWEDDFSERLTVARGTAAVRLLRRYCPALPEGYRAGVSPRAAVADIERLEHLAERDGVDVAITEADGPDAAGLTSVRIYRLGDRYLLSEIMPVLTNAGLIVVDESTYTLEAEGVPRCHLHTVRVKKPSDEAVADETRGNLRDALLETLAGVYENDVLSELVVTAGLTVRQVGALRAYVHYLHQIGAPHDKRSIASALSTHAELTRLLVRYFETKFDPTIAPTNSTARAAGPLKVLQEQIASAIDAVEDLNEDRILRGLFNLVQATVRTSYFQKSRDGQMAFKIRSAHVLGMPEPAPLFEILVHSAAMEGVHLRSGPVARGGIRWSDRRDDYRTEILGLMATQVTKNAIIVPVGSKGGFILKSPPDDRQELLREVERQYRQYITGLLSLTDNRVGDEIVHPDDTVIWDVPDPYLVVAADKGTATFSDVGNSVAAEFGFWLDDAFASGGSHGYDHKRYGITARGAWECVRWHFHELGLDVDRDEFTVAGIGDMSGDVFGNGMLLSKKIKLVAAFDHRHVFLDPSPDPETSWSERKRLFELPRSSWADYDRSIMGPGSGVFSRHAKRIALSREIRELLDVQVDAMSGEELIRAVLRARVDLLYNGGIGTYVKADDETHADASDERNDSVRVNAGELRCRVVAEGGNLGFTQEARIQAARAGVRVNTDFIDNSGGVDLSDHEVNLKIALGHLVRSGNLTFDERNELLRELGEEVCELVLTTNRSQARTLSLEEASSRVDPAEHVALLDELRASGVVNVRLDWFPDAAEMSRRAEESLGLLRPELATLLAFSKIEIFRALESSPLMEARSLIDDLMSYFPTRVRQLCGDDLLQHPLRREITATVFTNDLVHRCGSTFVSRLRRDLGCTTECVARGYRVADLLLGGRDLFAQLAALAESGSLPPAAATALVLRYRDALSDMVSWLVRSWPAESTGVDRTMTDYVDTMAPWFARAETWLEFESLGQLRERHEATTAELTELGASAELASRVARLDIERDLPALAAIAGESAERADVVATVYFMLKDTLRLDQVLGALRRLPSSGPHDHGAASALSQELRSLVFRLTALVAKRCPDAPSANATVGEVVYDNWTAVEGFLSVLERAEQSGPIALPTAVVLAQRLQRLLAALASRA